MMSMSSVQQFHIDSIAYSSP